MTKFSKHKGFLGGGKKKDDEVKLIKPGSDNTVDLGDYKELYSRIEEATIGNTVIVGIKNALSLYFKLNYSYVVGGQKYSLIDSIDSLLLMAYNEINSDKENIKKSIKKIGSKKDKKEDKKPLIENIEYESESIPITNKIDYMRAYLDNSIGEISFVANCLGSRFIGGKLFDLEYIGKNSKDLRKLTDHEKTEVLDQWRNNFTKIIESMGEGDKIAFEDEYIFKAGLSPTSLVKGVSPVSATVKGERLAKSMISLERTSPNSSDERSGKLYTFSFQHEISKKLSALLSGGAKFQEKVGLSGSASVGGKKNKSMTWKASEVSTDQALQLLIRFFTAGTDIATTRDYLYTPRDFTTVTIDNYLAAETTGEGKVAASRLKLGTASGSVSAKLRHKVAELDINELYRKDNPKISMTVKKKNHRPTATLTFNVMNEAKTSKIEMKLGNKNYNSAPEFVEIEPKISFSKVNKGAKYSFSTVRERISTEIGELFDSPVGISERTYTTKYMKEVTDLLDEIHNKSGIPLDKASKLRLTVTLELRPVILMMIRNAIDKTTVVPEDSKDLIYEKYLSYIWSNEQVYHDWFTVKTNVSRKTRCDLSFSISTSMGVISSIAKSYNGFLEIKDKFDALQISEKSYSYVFLTKKGVSVNNKLYDAGMRKIFEKITFEIND